MGEPSHPPNDPVIFNPAKEADPSQVVKWLTRLTLASIGFLVISIAGWCIVGWRSSQTEANVDAKLEKWRLERGAEQKALKIRLDSMETFRNGQSNLNLRIVDLLYDIAKTGGLSRKDILDVLKEKK